MSSKSVLLVALAVLSFAVGVVDQYFFPGQPFPPTALAYCGIGIFMVFVWYRLDSDQLGYRRSPLLNISVIGLAIVGLPCYFFRSRGAKRGAIATVLMLLALVAYSALNIVGACAAYYGLQS